MPYAVMPPRRRGGLPPRRPATASPRRLAAPPSRRHAALPGVAGSGLVEDPVQTAVARLVGGCFAPDPCEGVDQRAVGSFRGPFAGTEQRKEEWCEEVVQLRQCASAAVRDLHEQVIDVDRHPAGNHARGAGRTLGMQFSGQCLICRRLHTWRLSPSAPCRVRSSCPVLRFRRRAAAQWYLDRSRRDTTEQLSGPPKESGRRRTGPANEALSPTPAVTSCGHALTFREPPCPAYRPAYHARGVVRMAELGPFGEPGQGQTRQYA